jgi:hypothetical protein
VVVAVIEHQVVQADFGGDAFFAQGFVFEQRQLACAGQVQHMQAGAVALGQFHRKG